jgi:hypothetical protein
MAAKNAKDSEYLPQRREGAKEKSFSNLASWRLAGGISESFKILKILRKPLKFSQHIAVQRAHNIKGAGLKTRPFILSTKFQNFLRRRKFCDRGWRGDSSVIPAESRFEWVVGMDTGFRRYDRKRIFSAGFVALRFLQ